MKNFWKKLKKPIYILAPMEDVTDTVFRRVVVKCGKPDVFFSEFTSVEGMFSRGGKQVMQRLEYTEAERPIVAQIWGTDPDKFYKAATLLVKMGFDGIDINMGCPDKGVIKKGACSALIKDRSRAKEIIIATKAGASNKVPISIKTRLGFDKVDYEWIHFLMVQQPVALTVHLRTVRDMSRVPARWECMDTIIGIKKELKSTMIIIGNGDIKNLPQAKDYVTNYGIDGVMVGRGIFEDPYIFTGHMSDKSPEEKLKLLLYHVRLWDTTWGNTKHYPVLRKYFKIYVNGFPGAQKLREQLMSTQNAEETKQIIDTFVKK